MGNIEMIKADFEHELSIGQFPFHEIATNPNYLPYLFEEFSLLNPKPKFHLYFNEFISEEEWTKDRTQRHGNVHTSKSTDYVAANFIAMSALEIKANDLHRKFIDMVIKKSVDEKYFGRFIKDMTTYAILDKINGELDNFKKYVLSDANIDSYGSYAKAAAKKIIHHINTLPIEPLKIDLLEHIIGISPDNDFKFFLWANSSGTQDKDKLFTNFSYLKAHADELFLEAVNSVRNVAMTYKKSKYAKLSLSQLIQEGEGKFIEFKSTMIVNPDSKLLDSRQKHRIAKTIAAFLNSGGGALLIGVSDNKDILGLDADFSHIKGRNKFDNFRKSFDDLLSVKIGSNYHHLINLDFHRLDDMDICLVIVDASNAPVYCKNEDNLKQEFYIRRQTSTVALQINELSSYIQSNWNYAI